MNLYSKHDAVFIERRFVWIHLYKGELSYLKCTVLYFLKYYKFFSIVLNKLRKYLIEIRPSCCCFLIELKAGISRGSLDQSRFGRAGNQVFFLYFTTSCMFLMIFCCFFWPKTRCIYACWNFRRK